MSQLDTSFFQSPIGQLTSKQDNQGAPFFLPKIATPNTVKNYNRTISLKQSQKNDRQMLNRSATVENLEPIKHVEEVVKKLTVNQQNQTAIKTIPLVPIQQRVITVLPPDATELPEVPFIFAPQQQSNRYRERDNPLYDKIKLPKLKNPLQEQNEWLLQRVLSQNKQLIKFLYKNQLKGDYDYQQLKIKKLEKNVENLRRNLHRIKKARDSNIGHDN